MGAPGREGRSRSGSSAPSQRNANRDDRGERDDYRGDDRGRDDRGDRGDDRGRDYRDYDGGSKIPVGQHKITLENLPDDMNWSELKELGREYGQTLTFARTYRYDGANCGMLEYKDRRDADRAVRELDNRRIQGSRDRVRASFGDLARGRYHGGGGGGGGGRDRDYDDRRGGGGGRDRDYDDRRDRRYDDRDDRRDRYSPPRRSRSPPRRRQGEDEVITTLFLSGLPYDVREEEVMEDLREFGARRAVLMKRGGDDASSFVRFDTLRDCERAMDEINDGRVKVCRMRIKADIARRNTSL